MGEVASGRESLHSNAANPALATNGILFVAGVKRQENRNNKWSLPVKCFLCLKRKRKRKKTIITEKKKKT